MNEELYVLTPNGYERVDLNEPSGIQLNYNSYLFGDLSKITCSHTYTFKLPMTINNRRILDFAEDIRHQSTMIRKRISSSYTQNGVNLFRNANLYIESVNSGYYNAIMTWDVIEGLTAIKENDILLKELPNDSIETMFGNVEPTTENESFDNSAIALHPLYDCGIPYYRWHTTYTNSTGHRPNTSRYTGFSAYPMPVVPVYKVLEMINNHFNTKFKLGDRITIGGAKSFDPKREVIEKGVIPLVGKNLSYDERYKRRCYLSGITFIPVGNFLTQGVLIEEENKLFIPDVIKFTQIVCGAPNDYLESGTLKLFSHDVVSGTQYDKVGVQPKIDNISVEIDGCLQVSFTNFKQNSQNSTDEVPALTLYQRQQIWKDNGPGYRYPNAKYYEWVELDSIEGEIIGVSNGYLVYEYNFSLDYGGNRLLCENLKSSGGSLIFVFSHRINSIESMQKDIEIVLKNNEKCISPHSIDVIGNLPDISCLTFVKSLFYMIGAFPSVNEKQEIVPRFYAEIKKNLQCGNIVDWSNKLPFLASDLPSEIRFGSTAFAQSNYYIMKSDDLDSVYDPENVDDDVYESGIGLLAVENSTLEIGKTIIQLPFFAAYLRNRKLPSYDTGKTIKCWTLADEVDPKVRNTIYNRLEFCTPEPALGIIKDRDFTEELNTGEVIVKGSAMTMEVWNQFKSILTNESYAYLQQIIRKPFIIKENLRLSEFDLLDLDYTRPVYLDKYNSYFAIVSIQRDSKGKCICELIKLP